MNNFRCLVGLAGAITVIVGCLAGTCGAASTATRDEAVTDGSLNMVAATFSVPAKWRFVGEYFTAGNCGSLPYFVMRADSPDGLSYAEMLPRYGWGWGTGIAATVKRDEACMKLSSAISAREFVKLVSATMNLEYAGDAPVPEEVMAKARAYVESFKNAPQVPGIRPTENTRDVAWAFVRYRNGSFKMKGRLTATVDCNTGYVPGAKSMVRGIPDREGWSSSHCDGHVTLMAAPEEKFEATADMLDSSRVLVPRPNNQWLQAYMQRQREQGQRMLDEMRRNADQRLKAQADQFAHSQAVSQRMHEQFLSTMQRGTDMSMHRAAEVANSNHRMASDVVDYALDQQTVRDPGTGQITKLSSAYSYTWMDSTGKVSYQTNNPNANPNGSLPGNWSRQQVVHGDGSY